MSQSFQSQVISFIYEGVFERFPGLKMVLIEGGFAWLPPLAWRLDTHWKRLRQDLPHLKRLPSRPSATTSGSPPSPSKSRTIRSTSSSSWSRATCTTV